MLSNICKEIKIKSRLKCVEDTLIVYLDFFGDHYLEKAFYDEAVYDYTRTFAVESESTIISMIKETLDIDIDIDIDSYYIDKTDIDKFNGELNMVGISVDLRDPEFPYIFDGVFTITLSCTANNGIRDLTIQFHGGYNLYNDLEKYGLNRAIVVMHQSEKSIALMIKSPDCLQLLLPTPKGSTEAYINKSRYCFA